MIFLVHPYPFLVHVFLASTLYVQLRGHERYPFWGQLTDDSTFLAPYSALMYLFPKISTQPILDEALRLVEQGEIRAGRF